MYRRRHLPIALIALFIAVSAVSYGADSAVRVLIGNRPVDAKKVSPDVLNNQGLIPVRRTAQTFGARVRWDRPSRSLTISGQYAESIIHVGRHRASINGTPVYFSSPPVIYGGQTYAPIILFNRLYNMALTYDYWSHQFKWIPILPGPGYYSGPPPVLYGPAHFYGPPTYSSQSSKEQRRGIPSTNIAIGEVIRVYPATQGATITASVDGQPTMYRVAPDAIILRGPLGGQHVEVPLGRVLPGDQVTLHFNDQGEVSTIRAQFREASGKVQSVASNTVLLDTGETFVIFPNTEVILPGNNRGEISDIHVGDKIIARISPISGRAYMVEVKSCAKNVHSSATKLPAQLTLNTFGTLRSGDTLIVTFRAQPKGEAVFSIPGIKNDIQMSEIKPGVYQGKYKIQMGDTAIDQPVTVFFTAPDHTSFSVDSHPVTIRTVAGYLPRITFPHQGERVGSPLVVEGIADPGSLIRVTVGYRSDLQLILPLEGISDVQDVVADADGKWQTRALAVTTPFGEDSSTPPYDLGPFHGPFPKVLEESPTVYTITACSIGADGTPQSSYTVEVTKSPGKILEGFVPTRVEINIGPTG